MNALLSSLPLGGSKTYVVGVLMFLYGISALLLGHLDQASAVTIMGNGLGMVFLRHAVGTSATAPAQQ